MSNKTRIVVMGCGGASGVPYSGNYWGKCDPNNPKNARTRPSLFIEKGDTRLVIDTGPDFRQQINRLGQIDHLDAVLYSHAHYDHVNGIADLRSFFWRADKTPINAYASVETAIEMERRFDYIFKQLSPKYPAVAKLRPMSPKMRIGKIDFTTFDQVHGDMMVTGFRFGDFAYCTDVRSFPESSLEALKGIKTWIVDVYLDAKIDEMSHASLDQVKEWVAYLKPEMTYLTHLNAAADYDTLCRELPPHIRPAYDGMEILI